jgi:hypothetical protein
MPCHSVNVTVQGHITIDFYPADGSTQTAAVVYMDDRTLIGIYCVNKRCQLDEGIR